MSGGWVGGWIKWKYNQLRPQLGWVGAWAELAIIIIEYQLIINEKSPTINLISNPRQEYPENILV